MAAIPIHQPDDSAKAAADKSAKASANKAAKASANASKQKLWRLELKRLQHYLGIRATSSGGQYEPPPVLVSIDVEAFEFDQRRITEVGLSVLDCLDIINVQPGPGGCDWTDKIRARHFRVAETKHLVNKKFVDGCPENFQFGRSEVIKQWDLIHFLRDYFHSLPSTQYLGSICTRKVILVGHDVDNDVKYLRTLGFDPTSIISDCIDTVNVSRVVCRNARQQGLHKLLTEYDLPFKYLHNAGNDARYTLQAAIAIALGFAATRKTPEEWELEKQARIQKAIEEAIAKVSAELDGWSSEEDENDQVRAQLSKPPKQVYQSGQPKQLSTPAQQVSPRAPVGKRPPNPKPSAGAAYHKHVLSGQRSQGKNQKSSPKPAAPAPTRKNPEPVNQDDWGSVETWGSPHIPEWPVDIARREARRSVEDWVSNLT